MVARRHHGAGALGSSSSGVVRFLVKLAFLRRRVAFAAWVSRPPCTHISQRAQSRATALIHRKIVSTSRAKMYQAPPPALPLILSCGSKVLREIIARKEGGAWERLCPSQTRLVPFALCEPTLKLYTAIILGGH